jgi:urease accessory protein
VALRTQHPLGGKLIRGRAAAAASPLVGEGRGGRSSDDAALVPQGPTPAPGPSPAEPRYSEGSAPQQNDRSRQQPTSVGGGEQTTFAANRAHGRVSVALAATPRGTERAASREDGSLRVRFPNAGAGALEAVLINTAGGIAGGDRFAVDLKLDAGVQLAVTTAAAEKIYRSLGPDARVEVSATLAESAELTWLPQETILFDRARLARTIAIALAPGAKLLVAEMIVFGRSAMGETVHEGGVIDRWQVRRGGRLIFAESLRLDGPITDRLSQAAVAGGRVALGTVLIVPADDAAAAAVRAASGQFRGEVGISAWNGMALARLIARDGAALRHDLVVLLSALGRCALPRIWLN